MDNYLSGLSPFDPNGSLSNADADRIWNSYKAAGGGRDVSGSLPRGGGLPSGDGGRSMFGAMAGGGGLMDAIRARFGGGAAPAVPADGAMQPTIGPGAAPSAVQGQGPRYKAGLPNGGILGLLQGQSPQGLMGLLKGHLGGPPAQQPLSQHFGKMAGMIPPGVGMPGSPMAGPVAPVQLPMNINPADQF